MKADSEGLHGETFAINHSRPGSKVSRKGPEIQPFVELPGTIGNHTCTVGTDVFGQSRFGGMADIQTAKIDPYGQRNAFFQAAGNSLHGDTPRCT